MINLKLIDLTGIKFGRLTVIERSKNKLRPSGSVATMWLCKCDCGNEKVADSNDLRRGDSSSCGCLRSELRSQRRRKSNIYDLSGDYGIGYTTNGDEFYFDLEDYDKIKGYCWRKREDGYFDAKTRSSANERILLHKLILSTDLQIDHIKHNKYDNRKSQLRIVDNSKNQMNKPIPKNNKSGHKGVIWHKRDSVWEAFISIDYKQMYLGRYDNLDDAIQARKIAEDKYFGEYNYKT